jgi:hypothetical protein
MKVIVNKCYGGYGLSYEAVMEYARRAGITIYAFENATDKNGRIDFDKYIPYNPPKKEMTINHLKNKKLKGSSFIIHYTKSPLEPGGDINNNYFSESDIKRDDLILVSVVEDLGEMANGEFAQLEVIEIPDDIEWTISDYDGIETVEEAHRSW